MVRPRVVRVEDQLANVVSYIFAYAQGSLAEAKNWAGAFCGQPLNLLVPQDRIEVS